MKRETVEKAKTEIEKKLAYVKADAEKGFADVKAEVEKAKAEVEKKMAHAKADMDKAKADAKADAKNKPLKNE